MKIIPIGILIKGIRGMRKDLKLDSRGRDPWMNRKGMVPLFESYQVYLSRWFATWSGDSHWRTSVECFWILRTPGRHYQKILLLNQLGRLGFGRKLETYPWSIFVVWFIALTKSNRETKDARLLRKKPYWYRMRSTNAFWKKSWGAEG